MKGKLKLIVPIAGLLLAFGVYKFVIAKPADSSAKVHGQVYVLPKEFVLNMAGGRYKLNDTCGNCSRGFSSLHEGGAHFLMADGAVRFISENIDHNNAGDPSPIDSTYERLIAIYDRQPIGEF